MAAPISTLDNKLSMRGPEGPESLPARRSLAIPPQIDTPFILHEIWDEPEACPAVGPLERFQPPRCFGAKPARIWSDTDSTEIESVSVPTRLDRDVGMSTLVRVPGTRT